MCYDWLLQIHHQCWSCCIPLLPEVRNFKESYQIWMLQKSIRRSCLTPNQWCRWWTSHLAKHKPARIHLEHPYGPDSTAEYLQVFVSSWSLSSPSDPRIPFAWLSLIFFYLTACRKDPQSPSSSLFKNFNRLFWKTFACAWKWKFMTNLIATGGQWCRHFECRRYSSWCP